MLSILSILSAAVPSAARVFTSTHWVGIPVVVLGAVFLSLGTICQGRGVQLPEGQGHG